MQGVSRRSGTSRQLLAGVLMLAMVACWVPARAYAGPAGVATAEIRGSVLGSDGLTAVAGVSVKAANMSTRQVYSSQTTSTDGGYILSGLPAGSYDLAVETAEGIFAADAFIETTAGKATLVSLSLRPLPRAEEGEEEGEGEGTEGEQEGEQEGEAAGEQQGQGEDEATPPEPEQKKKKKKGAGFWRSPGGAAIAIVVGAGLVGAAANSAADDSKDKNEPPITPGGN